MACGYGACFGCAVPPQTAATCAFCVDGPVLRGGAIETPAPPGSGLGSGTRCAAAAATD